MVITTLSPRIGTLVSLLAITPIGFYTKFYDGPGAPWVNNSLGGVLYVIFWCLLVFLLIPHTRPRIICSCVLVITSVLEFMQLWGAPLLEWSRESFIGKTILGTTFSWLDFPHYVIGSGIGLLWLSALSTTSSASR